MTVMEALVGEQKSGCLWQELLHRENFAIMSKTLDDLLN